MKILLYKDLILTFLYQNAENKGHQSLINKIFQNENSDFLHSKKFLQFLKEELQAEYEPEYNALFTKFSDKYTEIASLENAIEFDDEVNNIYFKAQYNTLIAISYDNPPEEIIKNIPNFAALSQENKPNYHWLVVQLAILHPNTIGVRYYDFEGDEKVDDFFYDIFSISKKINLAHIFDDNCNFGHHKFRYLIENRIKVHYYTSRLQRLANEDRLNEMKSVFSSVLMFVKSGGAHAREIIVNDFVINSDHDFWGLNIKEAKKWAIYIQYNPEEAQKSLAYKSHYNRFM